MREFEKFPKKKIWSSRNFQNLGYMKLDWMKRS